MSVSSPCEVCLEREVRHTCDRCGKLVCDEHFDSELGVCTECAAELRRARGGSPEGVPDDGPDGVDTYRF